MFPRLPPHPSRIEYSLIEGRHFDATQGNIKQMANNPDTFWFPTSPPNELELHSTISRETQYFDFSNYMDEELRVRKINFKRDSTDNSEEDLMKITLNSQLVNIPLSIRVLQYFSNRHPKQFHDAILQIKNLDFENISPRDMLLIKRHSNNFRNCNEEFLEEIIALQKNNHKPNDKEMEMLKILSTQMIKESYEHIAVMLKGCGRSLMELQDAEKVNTYLRHPHRNKLYRCMHKIFGSRLCTIAPNEKRLVTNIHRAINIKVGGILPAYVASIKRPILQYKWWKNQNFPHGVGDVSLPDNTSSISIPFLKENYLLGVFEFLRFKDFPDFRELDKCLAQELLGLTQTAINLSIENSQIKKATSAYLTKDLYLLHSNFFTNNYTIEDIMKRIPLMMQKLLQAEKCYVVSFRDNEMFVYFTKNEEVKLLTCPINKQGYFWRTALEGKLVNIQLTQEQILSNANIFIWNNAIKDDLSPESFEIDHFNFMCQPVMIDERLPQERFVYSTTDFFLENDFEPIHIHRSYTEDELVDQQVLCLVTAVNKKNWIRRFDQDDENIMGYFANTLSSILHVSKYYQKIERKLQLLNLATEIIEYQTTPTNEEIEYICKNYLKLKNHVMPDLSTIALYELEPSKRIILVVSMLVQVLQTFSFSLKDIVNYTLSVRKRISKDNPWHNSNHWFIVSYTAYDWFNKYCQRFTELERVSFFLAANMTSVGHLGLTNEGLQMLSHPLVKLFPEAPIQNLAFELCKGLIVGPNALFNNLKEEESVHLLKNIKQILLRGDMGQFTRRKPFYAQLPEIMDWSVESHRLAVLEMLLFVVKRDYLVHRDVQIMMHVYLRCFMMEITIEGKELMENGFDVPDICKVEKWRSWPDLWMKMLDNFLMFAIEILVLVLPEMAMTFKKVYRNYDFLKYNTKDVIKKIKENLHLFPKQPSHHHENRNTCISRSSD